MASLGPEKRTPMAWQHRDMNYHQGGYQDKYGAGLELGPMRAGPPSTSDRLSHRTDKSWRTHPRGEPQGPYPPSRPSYSTGRAPSGPQSGVTSSTTSSSSSSESDSEQDDPRAQMQAPPQALYGYEGHYPGYGPAPGGPFPPPSLSHYPGTLKSAKSVPALGTWDGEPCPVHGGAGPMSMPGPGMPPHPHMMGPPGSMLSVAPPRRAASIYDMRLIPPPHPSMPGPIYGTLPMRPPPAGDRRSLVGGMGGIPPQLLPPMVRPRPIVVTEGGTAEPLPVRSPPDKGGAVPALSAKMADVMRDEKRGCRGGVCVGLVVMGVISTGLLLGVLLVFIL